MRDPHSTSKSFIFFGMLALAVGIYMFKVAYYFCSQGYPCIGSIVAGGAFTIGGSLAITSELMPLIYKKTQEGKDE